MTEIWFWCSAALVLYAYLGYPCALMMLSLVRNRPVLKAVSTPRVSFIITAHNEVGRIREKLDNTLAQNYPAENLEVIVASDCSTDATDSIVRGYDPPVRVVRTSERRGKEAAQQLAITESSGQILIFSDVATALRRDGVTQLVMNFADPTVGCVSSIDRFVDADGQVSGEGIYVRYEMFVRQLETRVNSLVGLSGSLFAARREVCRRWAADRQSDFSTLLNTVQLGLRGVLDPDAAGYYRNIKNDRREFERKIRTVVRGIAVLAANIRLLNPVRHPIFAWQLASHKICRWLVPFAMIAAAFTNAVIVQQSMLYQFTLGLQLGFYAAAFVGLVTPARSLRIPAYLVVANFAILSAWMRYARGERMTTWTPSERMHALPRVSTQ